MQLTKEQQATILEEHYQQCVAFWEREKHSKLYANALALMDVVHTKHNPFVPNGELLDAEVRRAVVEKHLQEFCVRTRVELEKLIECSKNE